MNFHHPSIDDIPFVNSILNDPDCRMWLDVGDEEMDFSKALSNSYAYVFDEGVCLAEPMSQEDWLCLAAFRRSSWGLPAINAMRQTARDIFVLTPARRLVATIMEENAKKTGRACIAIGFRPLLGTESRTVMELHYLQWCISDKEMVAIGNQQLELAGLEPLYPQEPGILGAFCYGLSKGVRAKVYEEFEHWHIFTAYPLPAIKEVDLDYTAFDYRDKSFMINREV